MVGWVGGGVVEGGGGARLFRREVEGGGGVAGVVVGVWGLGGSCVFLTGPVWLPSPFLFIASCPNVGGGRGRRRGEEMDEEGSVGSRQEGRCFWLWG